MFDMISGWRLCRFGVHLVPILECSGRRWHVSGIQYIHVAAPVHQETPKAHFRTSRGRPQAHKEPTKAEVDGQGACGGGVGDTKGRVGSDREGSQRSSRASLHIGPHESKLRTVEGGCPKAATAPRPVQIPLTQCPLAVCTHGSRPRARAPQPISRVTRPRPSGAARVPSAVRQGRTAVARPPAGQGLRAQRHPRGQG